MASTDAKAIPVKNLALRITFPILDADGDLVTGATGLDSEVSIDGGTFGDCTSEATEIARSSGMYFLDLTSGEMNGDTIAIIVKTTSVGAKTTPIVMYTAARSINDLAFPTTTGRSLDITATGAAGIDWANVENPTTSLNLSSTTVGTAAALTTNNDKTGYRLSATGVDDVWDEPLAGHTTAGTAGKQLQDISTGTAPTVAAIADGVWDELLSGHVISGSAGEALGAATAPSAAAVADAVWDELRAGHVVSGSFGEGVVSDSLSATAIDDIAEAIMVLDVDTVEGTAAVHSLCSAILKAVSRVVRAAGTETTYRTDGSTPHMSQTLTEDAGAVPVTEQTIAS